VADLQSYIDTGGLIGCILVGPLTDLAKGIRSFIGLLFVSAASAIAWVIYSDVQNLSRSNFIVLMFFLGFTNNSTNNIIQTVVTADLGKQPSLRGNKKAISLITGIIDGTGSMGTAIFQLITGSTFQTYGWKNGYFLVIAIDITIAIGSLSVLLIQEIREYRAHQRIVQSFLNKEEDKSKLDADGPDQSNISKPTS
jgi:sugar phosphate permease